jgi:hypothetical protein
MNFNITILDPNQINGNKPELPEIEVFYSIPNVGIYTLLQTPISKTELVTKEGLVLAPGVNYTINNNKITFVDNFDTSVLVTVRYKYLVL